jgi:hypothetical protein
MQIDIDEALIHRVHWRSAIAGKDQIAVDRDRSDQK